MQATVQNQVRMQDGAVLTCTVDDCAFNRGLECWAPKITVGEDHPRCDTYTRRPDLPLCDTASVVGWCGVSDCGFNTDKHCGARGITVDHHGTHADCGTFRP
jgi:hypothetical protein